MGLKLNGALRRGLTHPTGWVQRHKGSAISYNQRLLEDYMAHLGDPDAHLAAIEAYKAYLQRNHLKRKRSA